MRYIGAGGSPKADDPNTLKPGQFTLSLVHQPVGKYAACHSHEVVELFRVLEGVLTVGWAWGDEAIEARLTSGSLTPRAALEEEAREHLTASPDGRLRWRYARAAVASMYSELCREPPPSTVLAGVPTLLVHAEQFGLVREDQLEEYPATLGDGLELVAVPGGHVVYWDAFEPTADAVEKFLIRHSPVSHA